MGRRRRCLHSAGLAVMVTVATACTAAEKTDAEYRADVDAQMREWIASHLDGLVQSAHDLQAAAPTRAWSVNDPAIGAMQSAWTQARINYEHIEGAIQATFPSLDTVLDSRYEESLKQLHDLGVATDTNPFDDRGVIGMHAIERILYVFPPRQRVIDFEHALSGYWPAGYPSTDDEAIAFKTQLAQRLIDDAETLRQQWQGNTIDLGVAYQGLISLMGEQATKVNLAANGAEESRYANITLLDMRNNLGGTQSIYDLFREWIHSKSSGASSDSMILDNFDKLNNIYTTPNSNALPDAPQDWDPIEPTADNLATPYGMMWKQVGESVDPKSNSSVVFAMNQIATLLGLPALTSSSSP